MGLAGQVSRVLTQAGVIVESVSIGDAMDKRTWTVRPVNMQAAAQPHIDAFNPTDPSHALLEAQQELDQELAKKVIKALTIATHKRFKAQIATDSTTALEWQNAIRAEYDAL